MKVKYCDCDSPKIKKGTDGYYCELCHAPPVCDICYGEPSPNRATFEHFGHYTCEKHEWAALNAVVGGL